MFCFQCQETAENKGCQIKGVCGKTSDVADLQDLLLFVLMGISHKTVKMREQHMHVPSEINHFITESLFMTITNANFNKEVFINQIRKAIALRDSITGVEAACKYCDCVCWKADSVEEMEQKATTVGVMRTKDENVRSLRELLVYGLKGMAAYTSHALNLGYEDEHIHAFMQESLVAVTQNDLSVEELTGRVLSCGEFGVKAMALLDKANTESYGNPEITNVSIGVRGNPGILISGHDLRDLQELLEQTEGTGIDVYTHCEMLPAHSYPAFKKYKHFVGNYGNAWWRQTDEFESFNGVILFTSNCIVPPRKASTYADRVFTTGAAGFPGFKHIEDRKDGHSKDFSPLIQRARHCAPPKEIESGKIVGGCAHMQVLNLSDKIIEGLKSGTIRKFIVMAGCDGRQKSREYYTEFATKLPKDTIILTAGCAKFRYNKLPLGHIHGIPRVLDAGQCNDSYSIALIALKLKEAFGVDNINELPIVYNIAWYEQKAIIVLLALLSLGIRNIHTGPTLPAFLSPNIREVLQERFGLTGITDVDSDLKTLMI